MVPFRHGRRAFTKFYDERKFTLAMYVYGADPDGEIPVLPSGLEQLYANLDRLRGLFGRTGDSLLITRVMPDGTVRTAQAEMLGTMDFDTVKGNLARFMVDLALPDPFWYNEEESTSTGADAWTADGQTLTVDHPGNFESVKMTITILGICENPMLSVTGPQGQEVNVQVLVTDIVTDSLVIDTEAFSAEKNTVSVIGSLTHEGDPFFFKLWPGPNAITLNSDSAPTATVTVAFSPNWL